MSGYWIFAFGCVVGGCAGLLVAGLFGAAHRGEEEQEKVEAYYRGVKDGRMMEIEGHLEDRLGGHPEDPEIG